MLIPAAAVPVIFLAFFNPQTAPEPAESFEMAEVEPIPLQQPKTSPESEQLKVDVKGEVAKPGVYQLQAGDRVEDAVRLAGGLLPTAEPRSVNLAQRVQDEMVIDVAKAGAETAGPLLGAEPDKNGVVNINKADEPALMTLPGIGPSKAAAIIAYRTETGLFKKEEDLKNVAGIGDKTYEQLKDRITVN